MTSRISSSFIAAATIFALVLLALAPTAFAGERGDKGGRGDRGGDSTTISVFNGNMAMVHNTVVVSSDTGGNNADGGDGGAGDDGGDSGKGGDGTTEGNGNGGNGGDSGNGGAGGDGGAGAEGGIIITGFAGANAQVYNELNTNLTSIDPCGCEDEGDKNRRHHGRHDSDSERTSISVMNLNGAFAGNMVMVGSETGDNVADGGDGDDGGAGGDSGAAGDGENEGDDGDKKPQKRDGRHHHGHHGDDNAPLTSGGYGGDSGNGGAGGDAGDGGLGGQIQTGDAWSETNVVTIANRNMTRIGGERALR